MQNQIMQDKEITKVYQTNDYDKFKVMLGNRNINLSTVNKIEESIVDSGFRMCPILVNEKFEIIDGQHRFTALKELLLPIYYIMEDGLTIEDCKVLNINAKNWNVCDYVKSYADLGNDDYKQVQKFAKDSGIPMIDCLFLLGKHSVGGGMINYEVKNGNFKIFFKNEEALLIYQIFKDMTEKFICRKWFKGVNRRLSIGLIKFIVHLDYIEPFKLSRFLELLETKSNNLAQGYTIEELLQSVSDFYNKGLSNKIDFALSFEKYKNRITKGIFLTRSYDYNSAHFRYHFYTKD